MSKKDSDTPQPVLEIIAAERKMREEEQIEQQRQQKRQRLVDIEKGQALLDAWTRERCAILPNWAQEFVVILNADEDVLEHAGHYGHSPNVQFTVTVPGLAPIGVQSTWELQSDQEKMVKFIVPAVDNNPYDAFETPQYFWGNRATETRSLENALLLAQDAAVMLTRLTADYERKKAQWEQERGERESEARECDLAREQQTQHEKDEAARLLEMMRDDPVAIYLLKAFLAIRQDRSIYESKISEADEALFSLEQHWIRKATNLRRQAEEADRRAEEERSRAANLEDDLAKAEKKAKQ